MINNKLTFDNFEERLVNGVHIYSISNVALERYRNEAKRDKNISRDILERKLTAMILSCDIVNNLNGKKVYRFGGFCMIVNEKSHKIEAVSWLKDSHLSKGYMTMIKKKLKENNRLLGLNTNGNDYAKELAIV